MNDTLFLGPLIIPVRLLLLVLSGAAGYAALRYRLYRTGADAEERKSLLDPLGHVLFAGLILWKFSPLLLDTRFVLDHPLSLLYFTGGNQGLLLAALYAAGALAYRTWKNGLPGWLFPDALLTCLSGGAGVYMLLAAVFLNGGWFAAIASATAFLIYYAQLRDKHPPGSRKSGNTLTAAVLSALVLGMVHAAVQPSGSLSAADRTGIQVGEVAADFALTDLDGEIVRLSDYRGRKVLLNFWATWCPPCKAEMPHVQKFYEEERLRDVVVLGVNLTDTEKSADRVGEFTRERELTFPILLDESGQARSLYRVRAYPTSIFIDSQGVIRGKRQGAMSYDSLKSAFRDID